MQNKEFNELFHLITIGSDTASPFYEEGTLTSSQTVLLSRVREKEFLSWLELFAEVTDDGEIM
ncbi:hypothetical protein [Alteribacter lacisalsi]|uniref:hypothetical protein n=1 Tax=Alteribacter lacisalsi TaxID=2045244 RepID=UPI001158524F|nr:hypothetical protein [Alteribacter lacisalsi]